MDDPTQWPVLDPPRTLLHFPLRPHELRDGLVADIARGGRSIAADENHIDFAALHEQAAEIVGDDRVRHSARAELEGRERGALIARPRLIQPKRAPARRFGGVGMHRERDPVRCGCADEGAPRTTIVRIARAASSSVSRSTVRNSNDRRD